MQASETVHQCSNAHEAAIATGLWFGMVFLLGFLSVLLVYAYLENRAIER